MTIVEIIVEVMPLALSVIAFVMSIIARNKKMATKSLQQIESEAQALKQKYIDKQCKKNNVETTSTQSTEPEMYELCKPYKLINMAKTSNENEENYY